MRDIVQALTDATVSGIPIMSDGAMGSMLIAAGLPPGVAAETWNQDRPEAVASVHRAYVEAGACLITTNTIGASALFLEAELAERAPELCRLASVVAREVAGTEAWVAASIGPTGRLLAPLGDVTLEQVEGIFREQVLAHARGGADIILVETHYCLDETCAAVRMARQSCDLPVFCTLAFGASGRTVMGVRPSQALERAVEAGAAVVGANCGAGPEAVRIAIAEMAPVATVPLMAQANAGIPLMGREAETVWDVTPERMVEHAQEYARLGATIIGGCCGTTPEHIAAIAAAFKS